MVRKNVFVFVVCGEQEHLDALHYSVEALKKYSANEIFILTDSSRNEGKINHSQVIDTATPENLNHHQASIFLKTAIHRFVPAGNTYCYLDTDVVAIDKRVDCIFDQFIPPITFAPDHCVLDQFSPSAVNCKCYDEFSIWERDLKELFKKHKDLDRKPENEVKKAALLHKLEMAKKDKAYYRWLSFKFNLSRHIFKLDEDSFLNKKEFYWHDKDGNPILYEKGIKSAVETIESTSDYRFDKNNNEIWTIHGKNVFDCRCGHLREAIKETFGVEITDSNWQHWNGGVFLFNEKSHAFLDAWHEKTMAIFKLPQWKTRDQGTLIATAWGFGLQQHPTLSRTFNLIADYTHRNIDYRGNLTFYLKQEREEVKPFFVHVYHHWADKRWKVWQDVEMRTGIEIDPDSQTFNALWIGKTLSKLELLTIHSFLQKGYRFRLWLYEPLETPLPPGILVGDASSIIDKSRVFSYRNKNKYGHGKGSYAGFSDIFRYKLLYERGGWWVDMDVTCLKPFEVKQPYFFRNHHEMQVVGNIMKCPKNSALMKACYEEAVAEIDEHNTDWHKPIDILNENIKKLHLEKYIQKDTSNEDRWDVTKHFIWNDTPFPESWIFFHWQNEEWRLKRVNKNDFYYKSSLSRLLREHGLIEIPQSRKAEIVNELKHSEVVRKSSLFLAAAQS